jgi:hypothetical protein
MGNFLKDSVGTYAKQKCVEHNQSPENAAFFGEEMLTNKDVMGFVKEDLTNYLNGMMDQASGPNKEEIKAAAKGLQDNLDEYIADLDTAMTKKRDQYLAKEGNLNPNADALDQAIVAVSENSSYGKTGDELLKPGAKLKEMSTSKSKRLVILAKVCSFIGMPNTAKVYEGKARAAEKETSIREIKGSLQHHAQANVGAAQGSTDSLPNKAHTTGKSAGIAG